MSECSTPRGVIVWVTLRVTTVAAPLDRPPSAQRLAASSSGSQPAARALATGPVRVLNASRRHRLGSPGGRHRPICCNIWCSTPRGVIVWVGSGSVARPARSALLNASRRLRRVRLSVRMPLLWQHCCSTPRGVFVGFGLGRPLPGDVLRLLNASRRLRRVRTPCSAAATPATSSAQRLAASSSGSPSIPRFPCPSPSVLNASRRHRLGHTSAHAVDDFRDRVLNASRRLRRVRVPRARRRCTPVAAQRLAASSSGSGLIEPHPRLYDLCSTPRGVIVWVTASCGVTPRPTAAQRLAASSSGSGRLPRPSRNRRRLLNASRRHRRVRGGRRSGPSRATAAQRLAASSSGSGGDLRQVRGRVHLLNASRRLRRVRDGTRAREDVVEFCSTPRGVFVGFGGVPTPRTEPTAAAQRLAASSSGSEGGGGRDAGRPQLLNASRRLRRVRVAMTASRAQVHTAQRLAASSSGSAIPRLHDLRRDLLLNASRRLRRVRLVGGTRRKIADYCSTPRGVFVGFGPRRRRMRPTRASAQRLAASSSGSAPHNVADWWIRYCSTPRGVFVGFGPRASTSRTWTPAAQRLAASSSGSARRQRGRAGRGQAAQRLAASSSGSGAARTGCGPERRLLNASRRLRRVRTPSRRPPDPSPTCSTPRGVFVGFGRGRA